MNTAKRQKIRRGITFFMFLIFPVIVNYLSPVLILAGASEGIITGSFIVFALMFISSIFFGRAYCGFLCPASGMQEATERFRHRKAKTGWGNIVRWIVWITWLGFMIVLFIQAGGGKKADFLYSTPRVISIMDPVIIIVYMAVVLLVFVMTMIWGQRAFCKYLCWMGPFMIIGDKLRRLIKVPGLYLTPKKERCIKCGICTKECPMDIDVQAMVMNENMQNSECIMCLNCADICPKGVISTKRG